MLCSATPLQLFDIYMEMTDGENTDDSCRRSTRTCCSTVLQQAPRVRVQTCIQLLFNSCLGGTCSRKAASFSSLLSLNYPLNPLISILKGCFFVSLIFLGLL